jgi:hypothetical protein
MTLHSTIPRQPGHGFATNWKRVPTTVEKPTGAGCLTYRSPQRDAIHRLFAEASGLGTSTDKLAVRVAVEASLGPLGLEELNRIP